MHHIETSCRPTPAKARRLAPERYKLAKAEFESLMRASVLWPSSSNCSSALHIVDKKNGEIRPCGDYRALNALTKLDRYPVPNIQEFTSQLAGSTIFSRIDLVKAFHQIHSSLTTSRKQSLSLLLACLSTHGCRLDSRMQPRHSSAPALH